MAKEFIINTDRVNSYGTRVLTSGIDLEQFKRNPVLLYMHRRGFYDGEPMVIGRVENLRTDGDQLIGTPIFDLEFASKIARKWDNDFLRMCSAGLEPIEFSSAPEHVVPGQIRETIIKSKLMEVSIVDIGANDDALKLYEPGGKLLQLSAGEDNSFIPLLQSEPAPDPGKKPDGADDTNKNNQNNKQMDELRKLLGLADDAAEKDIIAAVKKLQGKAASAEQVELARIIEAVDAKIKTKPELAADRDKLINLGKTAGYETLSMTLGYVGETQKPTDFIKPGGNGNPPVDKKFCELSDQELTALRTDNREQYIKLFRAEFGIDPMI